MNTSHYFRRGRAGLASRAVACAGMAVITQHAVAEPAEYSVPDTMAQRLMACTGCHGKEGRASSLGYIPRIAGKPQAYLYNQLVNFREGRRNNAAMNNLLGNLSDAYLHEIAGYFSSLSLPFAPPQATAAPQAVLARGEALVRHGDPQRRMPACVQCHGAAMTGVAPAVPGLLGLPRDYLVGQLGSWRTDLRAAAAPDCMAAVAQALSLDDVVAAATWLSSQRVPYEAAPAAAPSQAMPLRCGSVER